MSVVAPSLPLPPALAGEAVRRCNLCEARGELGDASERALVRSNVRAFRDERFPVWRCAACRSIHAAADVDLARYYRDYPFHRQKLDWLAVIVYDRLRFRLWRAGLRKHHRVLDYGCGSGLFVRYLRDRGYRNASGYDAYNAAFADPAVLDGSYDVVVAQDVVEHAADPAELVGQLARLAAPGGVVAIGTPNAEAIDLARPDDFLHTLHQPYHTHLFSKRALLAVAARRGLALERYYRTQYSNTLVPGLNQRFCVHYARCFDDTIDLIFDGPRWSRKLLSPRALGLALFGWFFSLELDVMAVFRRPALALDGGQPRGAPPRLGTGRAPAP